MVGLEIRDRVWWLWVGVYEGVRLGGLYDHAMTVPLVETLKWQFRTDIGFGGHATLFILGKRF